MFTSIDLIYLSISSNKKLIYYNFRFLIYYRFYLVGDKLKLKNILLINKYLKAKKIFYLFLHF